MGNPNPNTDLSTIKHFGEEWTILDQQGMTKEDNIRWFNAYFSIFPWDNLPLNARGFDLGCGSGRWAKLVAPRVGHLHCIDPSTAIEVAKQNLSSLSNVSFHLNGVDNIPLDDNSTDFAYSLGVLHHIPDTAAGIKSCVTKLKNGAPFLLYLYYAFDNRPWWYRIIWKLSDLLRQIISRLPIQIRYFISQIIAALVYLPLARFSALIEYIGIEAKNIPLHTYRHFSFYVMRTDALDRFGTPLEKRFTKKQIMKMMQESGLEKIIFSDQIPYWCAIGYKK